jgi:hypothetical protein
MRGTSAVIDGERKALELLRDGFFQITEPGPLHAPILSFSIQRNEKLELILETRTPTDAKSAAQNYLSGTVRLNTDTVELTNVAASKATLIGVQPYRYEIANHYMEQRHELREFATVHRINAVIRDDTKPAYTVDWVDNLPRSPFTWPDTVKTSTSTSETMSIGLGDDGITWSHEDGREGFGRSVAKLTISGADAYVCAGAGAEMEPGPKRGCIIYVGAPDADFRKKVRNALSFALGVYLVDLGSTVYNENWESLSFGLRRGYSIDGKVFDLPVLHPAPLHPNWQHGIERLPLNRAVNSIFAKYDELDFGNLAWAYWHAVCATPHIAGVHFGAAIEALQRQFIEANSTKILTKIIPDKAIWKKFREEVEQLIAALNLPDESKLALNENIGTLNRVHQRAKMKAILHEINIELGAAEELAWKRRDDAAHGNAMEPGEELPLIQDTKLLKIIFHRMLLRITNASGLYFDYATPGFPIRNLIDPASPIA